MFPTKKCAETMSKAIQEADEAERIAKLSFDVRMCLAARLYFYCAEARYERVQELRERGERYIASEFASNKRANDTALRFVEEACKDGLGNGFEVNDIISSVTYHWRRI